MPRLLLLMALWLVVVARGAGSDLYSDPALDYQRSALVVAGRVVGIERTADADAAAVRAGTAYVVYCARIRIAACYKGDAIPTHELLIPIGGYWGKLSEADTSMQSLERDGGQRPLALEVGGLYLLFLVKSMGTPGEAPIWHPRSQQASILPIITRDEVPTVTIPGSAAVSVERYLAQAKVALPTVRPGTP